jgi:hypothetical protein
MDDNDRSLSTFREAYTEIVTVKDSKKYLFIPVKSRMQSVAKVDRADALNARINQVVQKGLDLDRIWKGFGTDKHKNFHGLQMIFGRGTTDSDTTTGTGWHCAPGNNWFVQVMGMKRWYFLDPHYSKWTKPIGHGISAMQSSNVKLADHHDRLPLQYADLRAGDLLYNPD